MWICIGMAAWMLVEMLRSYTPGTADYRDCMTYFHLWAAAAVVTWSLK